MNITIRPLVHELNDDYLDFFDNRAFTDDNPNGPCYCTSPNQTPEEIRQMIAQFKSVGVKNTLRRHAVQMLDAGMIHGYLAFDGDISVGWCNAADMNTYTGFVPDIAREKSCGRTISIVCFEIAPEYRGKGIASMFIERICRDAADVGYEAVEGYAKVTDQRSEFDFTGSATLYEKTGFFEVARKDEIVVMRKLLKADSLFKLAMKYIYVDGVPEDNALALKLLAQAHAFGHTEATYNLGICYHYGYGADVDLKTAYELYHEAANAGYGKGMELVGRFYNRGIYVAQDRNLAEFWLKKALKSDDPDVRTEAEKELNTRL